MVLEYCLLVGFKTVVLEFQSSVGFEFAVLECYSSLGIQSVAFKRLIVITWISMILDGRLSKGLETMVLESRWKGNDYQEPMQSNSNSFPRHHTGKEHKNSKRH